MKKTDLKTTRIEVENFCDTLSGIATIKSREEKQLRKFYVNKRKFSHGKPKNKKTIKWL
jgi:hypothetical protein